MGAVALLLLWMEGVRVLPPAVVPAEVVGVCDRLGTAAAADRAGAAAVCERVSAAAVCARPGALAVRGRGLTTRVR